MKLLKILKNDMTYKAIVVITILLTIVGKIVYKIDFSLYVTNELLTSICSIISILIGFVATAVSVFFSISDKDIFERIRHQKLTENFVSLFYMFFIFGIAVLVYSLFLVAMSTQYQYYNILSFIFIIFLEIFLYDFFKVLNFILIMLQSIIEER